MDLFHYTCPQWHKKKSLIPNGISLIIDYLLRIQIWNMILRGLQLMILILAIILNLNSWGMLLHRSWGISGILPFYRILISPLRMNISESLDWEFLSLKMEGNFSMKRIFLQVHSLLELMELWVTWNTCENEFKHLSVEWSETHCKDTKKKSHTCTVRKFVAPVPILAWFCL